MQTDLSSFERHCFMSDRCTELPERDKVKLLFKIDKEVDLFQTILKMGVAGEIILIARYKSVKKIVTRDSYSRLVFLIGGILLFGEVREDGF